jgi:hypothetical protein
MKNIKDLLGPQFVLAGYLPAAVLVGLFHVLFQVYLPSGWQNWLAGGVQTALGEDLVWFIFLPLLIGVLLLSLNQTILNFYKGAWLGSKLVHRKRVLMAGLVAELDRKLGQYRAESELETQRIFLSDLESLLGEVRKLTGGVVFFSPELLRPTRLGNVFSAIEEYPARRYGMAAATFWPRLMGMLSKDSDEKLRSQNASFLMLLNLATILILLSLLWLILGLVSLFHPLHLQAVGWAAVLLGLWVSVAILYRLSVSEAQALAEQVYAVFDLGRADLLKKMDLAPAILKKGEAEIWRSLEFFYLFGEGTDILLHPSTKDESLPTETPGSSWMAFLDKWLTVLFKK